MYKKIHNFMKYTGSKRSLAPEILEYFPEEIDVMIEPFCGSASITLTMIENNWSVNKYIISDTNQHVVNLLETCKNNPDLLIENYEKFWNEFNLEKQDQQDQIDWRKHVYKEKRNKFNESFDPCDFFCLINTCVNGLIRFNSSGLFNTSCHFTIPGANPKTVKKHIIQNSNRLQLVDIYHKSYNEYEFDSGFFFLDPPYLQSTSMYKDKFNHDQFFDWLKNCESFIMTMDQGLDIQWLRHIDLKAVRSSHSTVNNQETKYISERLFFK